MGIAFVFIIVAFVLTMSILMSIFYGIKSYVEQESSDIPVYVFLKRSAGKGDLERVTAAISQRKGVIRYSVISRKKAFDELLKRFSIDRDLFDTNPFPYTVEVFFEPKYNDIDHIEQFKKSMLALGVVDDVRAPVKLIRNMNKIKKRVNTLSRTILGILYGVEFVVFVSIITVIYSHRRPDYNTLKFFGIRRSRIFLLFLKQTFGWAMAASLLSSFFALLVYFLYDRYANVYYMASSLFKASFKTTFAMNVAVGLFFTLIASIFVFLVNDEKI